MTNRGHLLRTMPQVRLRTLYRAVAHLREELPSNCAIRIFAEQVCLLPTSEGQLVIFRRIQKAHQDA